MPGNGGGPEGPTACSALCSKGIFPASSRPPCTKRRLSVRLGGGYLAFSAHSCDILSYLIRFPTACQEFLLPIFLAWDILAFGRGDGRASVQPLRKYGKLSGERRRGRSQTGPPITDHVRCSTAGASPRPTKDGRSKSGRKPFKAGGRVPTLRFYEGAFEQWTGGWGHPPLQREERLQVCRRGRRPRRPAGAQCAPLQREKGSMPCAHWGSYPRGTALREGQAPPLRFSRISSGIG